MNVILMYHTPIDVIAHAIRTCTDRAEQGPLAYTIDYVYEEDESLINSCIKKGHDSVLEHVYYTFFIDGLSRAALQELARHRIASFSVKSTRWTLKQLSTMTSDQIWDSFVQTDNKEIDYLIFTQLEHLKKRCAECPNDVLKYALPEAFKTSVQFTINVRSLRNFLNLRSSNRALWEMRSLANEIFHSLPANHKFMFEDVYHNE